MHRATRFATACLCAVVLAPSTAFASDYTPMADLFLGAGALGMLLAAVVALSTRIGALVLMPLLLLGIPGISLAFTYMDTGAQLTCIVFLTTYAAHACATVWRLTREYELTDRGVERRNPFPTTRDE